MATQNPDTIAIIGRPNVGKSSLFNYLIDSRRSVVKNQPGVTRDLIFDQADVWDRNFQLVDTGGITDAADFVSQRIKEQVTEFLSTVDGLLVLFDGRAGLCPEDREIMKIVKASEKPYLLVVNKVDRPQDLDVGGAEFYEFGEQVVCISAENRLGMEPLLQWIYDHCKKHEEVIEEHLTLSLVGKPNVGKSSLCNKMLGEERMLVADTAGTTVDPVDSLFSFGGQTYKMIDTAGLRRSAKRTDDVEVLSSFKTEKAIRRSEIVLLMIDGQQGPTEQDARILQQITEAHKGVILVVNKLDLGEEEIPEFRKTTREKIDQVFHFYKDIPITFVSAKTGKGLKGLFEKIEDVREKLHVKIPTGELNDFFQNVIRKAPSPVYGTKNVKFYYLTQTHQFPPSFIAFANHPDGVDRAYRRFLINQIKQRWGLEGIPIRIFVMKSRSH